jgi:hypothetical protein
MHSFGHRANAVATFAVTILAAMCFAASFSDNFNSAAPTASVKVPSVFLLQPVALPVLSPRPVLRQCDLRRALNSHHQRGRPDLLCSLVCWIPLLS